MTTGSWSMNAQYRGAGRCGGTDFGYQITTSKSWSGGNKASGEKLPYAPHPYGMQYRYRNYGYCQEKSTLQNDVFTRCFGGPPAAPAYVWSGSDELALLGKLADLVRGHDFNAGVFAGTGHQTVGLIGNNAHRLANGLRALKSGLGPRAIVNALNGARGRSTNHGKPLPHHDEHRDVELSRRWLEASYGWMPLLSDTHAAAEALAKHVQGVRQTQFRARIRRFTYGTNDTFNTKGFSVREYRVQLILRLKSEKDLPSEFVQLGLTDPLSIAWELVPWSFAIDWFLPIGSMLLAAALMPKLSGTQIRTVTDLHHGSITLKPQSQFRSLADASLKDISVTRTVTNGSPRVPFPSVKSPISKSWIRAANQIALLAGLRSRF